MTADFLLLLVAALFSGWGTAAALLCRRRRLAGVVPVLFAVLLFSLAGVSVVLWVLLTGDGRVLPGLQLNPDQVWTLGSGLDRDAHPLTEPLLALIVLLAHLVLWAPRPRWETALLPLPATLGFVGLLAVGVGRVQPGRPIEHQRALAPGRAAYLTVVPAGKGVKILVAAGRPGDLFLDLLYFHEAETPPPRPRIRWTLDGEAIVVSVLRQPLLGIEPDGTIVGRLPGRDGGWPSEKPALLSAEARRLLSRARFEVDGMLRRRDRRAGGAR
ncbi:MAG: hypothetical protein ACE5JG_07510 [Planctomycetota bacterium]